jgi:hypothetical protein
MLRLKRRFLLSVLLPFLDDDFPDSQLEGLGQESPQHLFPVADHDQGD